MGCYIPTNEQLVGTMTPTWGPTQKELDVSEQRIPHTFRKTVAYRAFNLKLWQPFRQLRGTASLDAPTLEQLLLSPCDGRSNEDPFSVGGCDASLRERFSAYSLRATTDIIHEDFLTLLQAHPPRNAKACAGYLKDRMRTALHRSKIYSQNERLERHQHVFRTVFFPRMLAVIEHITVAEDGELPALDLCVYAKLDCLHGSSPFFSNEAHQNANRQIDRIVRNILQSIKRQRKAPRRDNGDAQARQPDAAYLCQSIRRFCNHYHLCDHISTSRESARIGRGRGCVRVNTAVVLDLLQRHAYIETKLNVYRAVGKKLPKELADMILKLVLSSQGQPNEPGIFDRDGKAVIHCGEAVELRRTELL